MQTLFTKALATSVAVAGLGLLAAPQANAAIFGSFALSGPSTLVPGQGVDGPPVSTPTIIESFCDNGTGAFAPGCNGSANTTISGFGPFTQVSGSIYSIPSFTITFNSGVIPPSVLPYTVTVDPGTLGRTGGTQSSNFFTFPNSLTAIGSDGTTFQGTVSIGNAGGSSTFQMNFASDNVPEPLTMLGASAAVAFGAAFKRRSANKG
ncbi:MAG: PEP-CTERM sorting domain-containing protein [Synechocystis sp.]|nr:PEP-CTERM sorting domain-containing protein [Synechocystis sp.]